MEWLIGLGLLLGGSLLLLMWSLLVVASDADDRAEQSFEEWKKAQRG